ncbi:hypothetical protein F2Q70_00007491 [Brassica cretica]|uniref:Uncharacterized protein n=1 Tax=Brassica cretica TaxID=69181 RepID=A0A8S9MAI5_BRACR|nr:hypothetical protein F2Q70_00007491 [Brassica cretica]
MSVSSIGFEGYEKRLEVTFFEPSIFLDTQGLGLRALTKSQIDEILNQLNAPSLAGELSLDVDSVRYTRGSFICPGGQPFPHRNFSEEVSILDGHFTKLGLSSVAYLMGKDDETKKWHVYSASSPAKNNNNNNVYTLEMCMTCLDKDKASVVEGDAISTIHVTPEDGFSYAASRLRATTRGLCVDLEGYGCRETTMESLGDERGIVMYQMFEKLGMYCGSPRSTLKCEWSSNSSCTSEDDKEERI